MAEGQRLALPRILCLLSAGVAVSNAGAPHSSVMLQELSHMDRITQLQNEIEVVGVVEFDSTRSQPLLIATLK